MKQTRAAEGLNERDLVPLRTNQRISAGSWRS